MEKIKDLRRKIFNEMNIWAYPSEKKEQVKQMVDQMVEEAETIDEKAYDRGYDSGFKQAHYHIQG